MSDSTTTLILGGGVGGVVTARTLRKKLPSEHRVIIVDREYDHLFAPSLLWLMTGQRSAGKIRRPLGRLGKKGIEVKHAEIQSIDPGAHRVGLVQGRSGDTKGAQSELDADYIVVSLGAELAPDLIPGLEESGHNFYTLAGAESFWAALRDFDGGRIIILTATPSYKCPAAPYEAAMLIQDYCDKSGVGARTQVELYTAEAGPMGVTGPDVSAGVRMMVEDKGISYHPDRQVEEVDTQARRITFEDGTTAEFDLLAYVPPHRAPQVVRDAGLVDDSGWIPVDANTMDTEFDRVYAIGDVTGIPLEMGKPLPMAGVFAEREGRAVAANIALDITGRGDAASFNGYGECFVETGGRRAGFGKGNFYALPTPQIQLFGPSRRWHIGKVIFEKDWFRRWL